MEITFLGTGVAIPQRGRVQSGVLVRLEEKPLLIDCGSGVLSRFPEAEISHIEVDTVLLSHLHLDHVADLLCLLKANWLRGKTDMRIYGPEGTEDWLSRVLGAYEYIMDEDKLLKSVEAIIEELCKHEKTKWQAIQEIVELLSQY